MKHTRRAVGSMAVAALAGGAGCLGFVRGDEALEFAATAADPSDDALAETGYERRRTEEMDVVREFSAAGQTREVEVANVLSEYDKGIDMGPLGRARGAVFVAFATPQVEVLGRTFNPVGDLENRELAEEFQSQYEGVTVGDELDVRTIRVLGDSVDLSKFDAQAEFQGVGMDVYFHLGTAEADDEGDFVVVIGVHPQHVGSEEENVVALAESLTQ